MKPIIIAITGASALPIAEKAIQLLLENDYKVELILSKGAYEVAFHEQKEKIPVENNAQEIYWRQKLKVNNGSLICHRWNDNAAPIASGSYKTKGMVIVPCTMGTIGRISSGTAQNLIERTADVHLKESRPLIISPRESPYNLIHIENMARLIKAGARISPPIPAWYSKPQTLEDMVEFIVVRLFDTLLDDLKTINRWGSNKSE